MIIQNLYFKKEIYRLRLAVATACQSNIVSDCYQGYKITFRIKRKTNYDLW